MNEIQLLIKFTYDKELQLYHNSYSQFQGIDPRTFELQFTNWVIKKAKEYSGSEIMHPILLLDKKDYWIFHVKFKNFIIGRLYYSLSPPPKSISGNDSYSHFKDIVHQMGNDENFINLYKVILETNG